MKKKVYSTLLIGFLLVGSAFVLTSCSEKSDDFVETAWNIENFTVNATQWTWNSDLNRWEAIRPLEYIDDFIYENGAVIGFVFLGTQNVNEVQTPLPYIKSYLVEGEDGGLIDFTETIGFEYSMVTNRVTFYIEPSDGFEDNDARQNYNFRIVMIW